jgi:hypothetical protein
MERSYRWAREKDGGLEHLSLRESEDGFLAEGVVIGADTGLPFGCSYAIRCDARWHVRSVHVHVTGAAPLLLQADGEGHWCDGEGRPLPVVDGCIDVDLSCTPLTNTLPIRRLGSALEHRQEIRVAYVDVPALRIEAVPQAYRRTGPHLYLFESLSHPFSAEIATDDDGVVRFYPGLFNRVLA